MPLEDCLSMTSQLQFKGGASFWNNALYSAEGYRFRAGTGISVSSQLVERIIDDRVIAEGRVQYIIVDINGVHTGIMNIYASCLTGERARFWNFLAEYPFPQVEWVVGGDFNMAELGEDRTPGFHANNMGIREQNAWSNFILRLGVSDIFYEDQYRKVGNKRHTWCRERPSHTWSRLDRFYTNFPMREGGGLHGIWPTLTHISDHAPVFLKVTYDYKKKIKKAGFNKTLLYDSLAQDKFQFAWKSAMEWPEELSKGQKVETALEHIRKSVSPCRHPSFLMDFNFKDNPQGVYNIITQCWMGVIRTMYAYCSSHHFHYSSHFSLVANTPLSLFKALCRFPLEIFLVLSTCRIRFLFTGSHTGVILLHYQMVEYSTSVGNFKACVIMLCLGQFSPNYTNNVD
jgi:exonuclease III